MSGSPDGIYMPGVVDPGVPIPNPTSPYWLSKPSVYSKWQSPWPNSTVDVAIIGSGMSAMGLARALYQKRPNIRIIIIEARELCSGATGRNGGHIKTMSYGTWPERKRLMGVDEAIRVTAFEQSHVSEVVTCIQTNNIDCDLELLEGLDTYYEQGLFQRSITALDDLRKHAPSLAEKYTVYSTREELSRFKCSEKCVGAIGVKCATVWPYRFVTGMLGQLIEKSGLLVETNTVVQQVDEREGDDFAVVKTNRGNIQAKHVVHATNGWLGHLVHELRPFISPVRGNVLRQMPLSAKYRLNNSFWSRYADKDYDYLIQRAQGDIIVGRASMGRAATGDDSTTDIQPQAHLRGIPSQIFDLEDQNFGFKITHAWSGILGYTQDKSPLVGQLPYPGRRHQWVCCGYQGLGMVKAFKTGQMVAMMILGEEIPQDYPRSMLLTSDRIKAMEKTLSKLKL